LGQGFKDINPSTKKLMKLVIEGKVPHGGYHVLRWITFTFVPTLEISTEKIDEAVATIYQSQSVIVGGLLLNDKTIKKDKKITIPYCNFFENMRI